MGEKNVKKIACFLILAAFLSAGCASVKKKVRSIETLKYKTVLIMPFSQENEADQRSVYDVFFTEMQQFNEIKVIDRENLNQQFMEELGLNHPLTVGVVDFSETTEGHMRLKKVREVYDADAIIFGSLFVDGKFLSLAVQMLDVEDGSLTLSFTREIEVSEGAAQDAWAELAKQAVEKVIDHIQDNRVVTSVYKYE